MTAPVSKDVFNNALLAKLREDGLWKDRSRAPELMQTLAAAEAIRTPEILDVLAERIGCRDPRLPLRSTRMVPIEEQYPAYGALVRIGSSASRALLRQLTSLDPDADPDPRTFPPPCWGSALTCLASIYGPGRAGVELAIVRVRQELKSAKGKERQALLRAIQELQDFEKKLSG